MYSDIKNSLNSIVYKTNILLRGKLQSTLKDFDITSEQWITLERLNEKDGCNQKELSDDIFKEPAAITRTLDILEKKRLIERRKSSNDRREYLVFITSEGKNMLDKTFSNVKSHNDLLKTILNEEETAMLKSLLYKLCKGLLYTE